MKKVIVFFTCIVLLLVVGGCSQPQPATPTPTTPIVTTARPTTAPPVTAWTLAPQPTMPSVSDNTISIQNMAFNPPSMTVKKGAIVRWVNNDAVVHTVTFKTPGTYGPSGIDPSGPLSASQSFSVKFDEPGTYPYSCAIHPSMLGTIIVV